MPLYLLMLAAGAVLAVLLFLQFRWRYRHILRVASKLPCPPALPVIGNALFFIGGIGSITKDIVKFMMQFKGLFCIWIGPMPVFVVSDPSDVQIVLNSSNTLEKDDLYDFFKPYMGNGLLTAPVPIWKKYRRIISPTLQAANVEKFLPMFNQVSRTLVKDMKEGGDFVDPKHGTFKAATDAVMTCLTGRKPFSTKAKDDLAYLLDRVGWMFVQRLFKVWLNIDWIFNVLYRREMSQALKTMEDCYLEIDRVWKEEESYQKKLASSFGSDGKEAERKSILDVHNCWDRHFDPAENHDWYHEITTMIVGATDTVTNALTFILFTLANDPVVQTKVYAEIQEVLGHLDKDATLSDIYSLKYMDQVIMESMRVHGVFPVILRRATKDTKLTNITLPAGSRVMIPLHAMGWNPDQFPEPEKFMPERFSPETQQKGQRHIYAFLPFSAGPRNCPGKIYGMFLMKVVLVNILRNFRVTSDMRLEDLEYDLKVVMHSKQPLLLRLHPR